MSFEQDCLENADLDPITLTGLYEACVIDMCASNNNVTEGLCPYAKALAVTCQNARVPVPDWREGGFCGKYFSFCGKYFFLILW